MNFFAVGPEDCVGSVRDVFLRAHVDMAHAPAPTKAVVERCAVVHASPCWLYRRLDWHLLSLSFGRESEPAAGHLRYCTQEPLKPACWHPHHGSLLPEPKYLFCCVAVRFMCCCGLCRCAALGRHCCCLHPLAVPGNSAGVCHGWVDQLEDAAGTVHGLCLRGFVRALHIRSILPPVTPLVCVCFVCSPGCLQFMWTLQLKQVVVVAFAPACFALALYEANVHAVMRWPR